ncbi:hypothetical protein [Williamsia deligens]|uniref:Aldehyde dehydrogenase family protein n=1 Tax=Williamsia deligens TaxID=321325 RepID=A0ABW3G5Y3_9NOCA|nr:hypothetical protein [Williamsia deligens]
MTTGPVTPIPFGGWARSGDGVSAFAEATPNQATIAAAPIAAAVRRIRG